jgi:hypothetical protein
MTDTIEYPKAYSCCMRHYPEPSDILIDGIHINFILIIAYAGSFALGMPRACLGSFIAILLNSIYMMTMVYPYTVESQASTSENEAHEADDDEAEDAEDAEDDDEADEAEDAEGSDEAEDAEVDTDLSLKQREHGARKSKSLSEEDDAVLYEKLYEIVRETQRRNELRSRALTRTPTSSSLAELMSSEDEYADMPPLIDANSVLRFSNTKQNKKSNDRIPTIREILDGYTTVDKID